MENFVSDYKKLMATVPRICVSSRNVENCPYGDFIYNCKNCYLCFDTGGSQNGYHLDNCMKTRDCTDCSFARWSELCYQCLNIEKCYDCNFCTDCNDSRNLRHCFDCIGCNDCFGCVGLRRQKFQIYNQQFSEQEYRQQIKNIKFDEERFHKIDVKIPRQNLHLSKSENCVGDYIYNSKDCFSCYEINNMENCLYYSSGNYNSADKDCCDIDEASGSELCYDSFSLGYCYNCNFLVESSYCRNCEFGINLEKCTDCFGCAYLANKQYHILNKSYTKEEYLKKVKQISRYLKENGLYGLHAVVNNELK